MSTQSVFFVSDRTGITAQTLGHGLLTQFPNIEFKEYTIPFVDSEEKALQAVDTINEHGQTTKETPIVFCTIIDESVREILGQCKALVLDYFHAFLKPLENTLGVKSSHQVGLAHSIGSFATYKTRIDAVNFALRNDDGLNTQHYKEADVIIVGVSRSGKTPTCLYMALHFGLNAANYPLTEEELEKGTLPLVLSHQRKKIFGLSIDPKRLCSIRSERKANSRYAAIDQCQWEVNQAQALFDKEGIEYINTTYSSIEEISTKILQKTGLKRHIN